MGYDVGGLRLDRPFRIERIGHFGFHTRNLAGTIKFLTEDLGLQISDFDDFTSRVPGLPKEDAMGYFIRCSHDHHALVIGSQRLIDTREPERAGALVNQVSWQVGSLRQVVDGVGFLEKDAELRRIGRDAPGSNWHVYAYDPDRYVNEIYYGMEQIGWDGNSKPKSMYDRAFRSKPELPQIPEYREADDVLERGETLEGYRYAEARSATFDVEGVLMPQPFKLTRLSRVLLFVEDPEASLSFYSDILGLTVSERRDVRGHGCVFLRAGAEHHSLALMPNALRDQFGIGAACSFSVASYRQFRDAYDHLKGRGARMPELPDELSPGIRFGFWVQGPDDVAIQLVYGQERHGGPAGQPAPRSAWPDLLDLDDTILQEPVFVGPLA